MTAAYTESEVYSFRSQRSQYVGVKYNMSAKSNLTFQVQHAERFKGSNGLFGGLLSDEEIDFGSAFIYNLAYQAVF